VKPKKPKTKQEKGAAATRAKADAHARCIYTALCRAWIDSAGNLAQAAKLLNARRVPTLRSGYWYAASVARTVDRLERLRRHPLVRPELLNAVFTGEPESDAAARFDARRKAYKRLKRQAEKLYLSRYSGRLRETLPTLYGKHTAAKWVARDLESAGLPAPPYSRGWTASTVLRFGRRVGVPWLTAEQRRS
jgi:hypothetical protein